MAAPSYFKYQAARDSTQALRNHRRSGNRSRNDVLFGPSKLFGDYDAY